MKTEKNVVAILFGRGGSRGLPGKNIKKILNRPSLHYPLLAAQYSGIVREIFVTTDSAEIEQYAAEFSSVPIGRPKELASDSALLEDAIYYAYQNVTERTSYTIDYVLILLCNSCNVISKNISRAYSMLNEDRELDSVTTVAKYNMFSPVRARSVSKDKILDNYISMSALSKEVNLSCDRDLSEDCYYSDHGFTLARSETLSRMPDNPLPFRWMGNRIGYIIQEPGGGDIDYEWQVPLVEWWLKRHGFTEDNTPY